VSTLYILELYPTIHSSTFRSYLVNFPGVENLPILSSTWGEPRLSTRKTMTTALKANRKKQTQSSSSRKEITNKSSAF